MNLTNQQQTKYTAIVTGSTRGIGKETALLLLKNGMKSSIIISGLYSMMYRINDKCSGIESPRFNKN